MKLYNTADMQQAKEDLPAAGTAVLRLWDWREESRNKNGVSTSATYVSDGEGGWKVEGFHMVERATPRKWQATHRDNEGVVLHVIGTFPTKTIAKGECYFDLVRRLGESDDV